MRFQYWNRDYNRYVAILDKDNNRLLVVKLNIFKPDCLKWKEIEAKGLRALTVFDIKES